MKSSLRTLANKIASKVLESKRSYRLDPMNSFERRIIHEALADNKYVYTESFGEEPERYVVVKPRED